MCVCIRYISFIDVERSYIPTRLHCGSSHTPLLASLLSFNVLEPYTESGRALHQSSLLPASSYSQTSKECFCSAAAGLRAAIQHSLCVFFPFALKRLQCFAVNRPLEVLRSAIAKWVSSRFIFDSLSFPPTLLLVLSAHAAGSPVGIFGVYLWGGMSHQASPPPTLPSSPRPSLLSHGLLMILSPEIPDSEEILSACYSREHHPPAAFTQSPGALTTSFLDSCLFSRFNYWFAVARCIVA